MIEHEFGPVTVPSCHSVNVFIQPKKAFWPELLVIPDKITRDFLITDIKIDKDSQLIGSGCLPAMIFSSSAVPELLSGFNLVKETGTVRLSITNQSKEPRTFSATLRGATDKQERKSTVKKYFLGYGSSLVASHSSALISIQASLDLQPFRLIVPSTIHDKFKILGLSIRSRNQLLVEKMDNSYLDQSFDETSLGQVNFGQPAKREQFLTLTVKNTTDHPENFQGAILGYAL